MKRIEKTVFISYRRTNAPWALAVFQDLTQNGYDVFFDFQGIASGDFEKVILANIESRAHFIVLLTPSALDECGNPNDWLRRETETAIDTQRNIVPLMLEGFDFSSPLINKHLKGKLAFLSRYNALRVPIDFFPEAMTRLREKYLDVPLDSVLHPTTKAVEEAVLAEQAAASTASAVQREELDALEWFERGMEAVDIGEKLRCYTEAIGLNSEFAHAYNNRGYARSRQGDRDGAFQDYEEAIRLNPEFAHAYNNRAVLRGQQGDLDGALQDIAEAIRLNPEYSDAFLNRANVRELQGNPEGALQDLDEAIRLNPANALAYTNRGGMRDSRGDRDGALQDYNEATRLNPEQIEAYNNRGAMRSSQGDFEGALRDYNEAIRLNSEFDLAYSNRGLVYEASGRYSDAVADFQKYLELGGGLRRGDQAETEKRIRKLKKKKRLSALIRPLAKRER